MFNIDQDIAEYEYILQALNEGVSIKEIREEISRMEHENAMHYAFDTSAAKGLAYENQA